MFHRDVFPSFSRRSVSGDRRQGRLVRTKDSGSYELGFGLTLTCDNRIGSTIFGALGRKDQQITQSFE